MIKKKHDSTKPLKDFELSSVLDLYLKELKTISTGTKDAHKYHLLASRIFFEIFREQLGEPNNEREINEGRGRIDFTCKNKNKEGIFKNLKELRDIKCPEVMVECKNYENDLTNDEYSQLSERLISDRGVLGFLLCRNKKDKTKILKHCQDRKKGGKYIIVLDDKDVVELANYKLNDEDSSAINDFVENKIKEIID
ncbi:MAG: hypothetical protein Q7S74_03770 [Nanoarchaeota archaeon]|nr:hypothetical protein [Nanoarchaeota archaeon]